MERNHAGIDCCHYQCKKIFLYANTLFFAYRTNISSFNPGAPNSDNTRRRIAYWEGILSK